MLEKYGFSHQAKIPGFVDKIQETRKKNGFTPLISKEQLFHYYVVENIGSKKISRIFKCSDSYIRRLRREWGIPDIFRQIDFSKIISKSDLERYKNEQKTASDIADIYGCSKTIIYKLYNRHNITPYTNKIIYVGNISEETIRNLYVEKGKSTNEIGGILGCSSKTVLTLLHNYNIEIRLSPKIDSQLLERDELIKLHHEDLMSLEDIGELYGVTNSTMSYWFKKMGIPILLGSERNAKKIRKKLTPGTIYNLYYDEYKTAQEIAYMFNISSTTVLNILKEHGFEILDQKREVAKFNKEITEETLNEMYYEEGLTVEEIGYFWGVSEGPVRIKMEELGMIRRRIATEYISKDEIYDLYYVQNKSALEIGNAYGFTSTTIYHVLREYGLEERHKTFNPINAREIITKEELSYLYYDEKMPMWQIAEYYGYSYNVIISLMEEWGLKRRKQSGENHVHWKGGTSFFNQYFRFKLDKWRKKSMENCDFKCAISGEAFDHIHHLRPFHLIVEEALNKCSIPKKDKIGDYSSEELEQLGDLIEKLHWEYPLGVCLKKDIHNEFHNLYGFDTTMNDFNEFKESYKK